MGEVWADRLTPSILWAALWIPERPQTVRYLTITRGARWLARLLAWRLRVAPLDYPVGDLRMPGSTLGLSMAAEKTILEGCTTLSAQLFQGLGETGLPEEGVRLYLLKTLAEQLEQIVSLALYARIQANTPVVLLRSDVHALIRDWPMLNAVRVRPVGWLPRTAAGTLLWGLLSVALVAGKLVLLHRRGIRVEAGGSPQVLIQWQRGIDLQTGNDYAWYPFSGLGPERITFYSDRPDAPFTPQARAELRRRGHHVVDLQSRKPGLRLFLHDPLRVLGASLRLVAAAVRQPSAAAPWCLFQTLKVRWLVAHWEAVFRAARARIFIQWSVNGGQMVAQAMAMRRLGGATVLWHWSHLSYPSLQLTRQCDVFFTWGPYYRDVLLAERSLVGEIVENGHFNFIPPNPERTQEVRASLQVAGAQRIVGFFDSSVALLPQNLAPYSQPTMLRAYQLMLQTLLDQPELGLILKPKFPPTPGPGIYLLPELQPLLERALATGRCRVVHGGPPLEAGLACDLVVGIGINSAALECAVAGKPAVYLDVGGDAESPLHGWSGRLVFTELGDFAEALRRWAATGDDLGRHGPELAQIDPFRDGQAWQRMGSYLGRLLTALDAGAGVEEAARAARETEAAQHGI